MPVTYTDVALRRSDAQFSLSTDGLRLTLEALTFQLRGREFSLPQQEHAVAVDPVYGTQVVMHLAVADAGGSVVLVVDEISLDGQDGPLMKWAGTGYRRLWTLGVFDVPAGAASLDEVPINVSRVQLAPEPVPEQEG